MRSVFTYYDEKDYLAHWGIKGQKWGIRRFQNPDGTLTEEGKKRYGRINSRKGQKEIEKLLANTPLYQSGGRRTDISEKAFSILHADKRYLKKAEDAVQENTNFQKQITKDVDEMFSELRSDKNMAVYEAASELAAWPYYVRRNPELFNDTSYSYSTSVDDLNLASFADAGFMGCLEDGQQSPVNAYSMWVSKHGLEQKVDRLNASAIDAYNNAQKKATDAVTEGLSEVNADSIFINRKLNYKLQDRIVNDMMTSERFDSWDDVNGMFYLDASSAALKFTKEDKSDLTKAERYVKKLSIPSDKNTWWYVREAAENLGMSSTQLKNLSQSDWDRINREIQKLKDSKSS